MFIGIAVWVYAILYTGFVNSDLLISSAGRESYINILGILFFILIGWGIFSSIRSFGESLNTIKAIGVLLNFSLFVSLIILALIT